MSDTRKIEEKRQSLNTLKAQVAALEAELAAENADSQWNPEKFYSGFYLTSGFVLGGVAAMASLLFNVIGSTIAGKHPLELIRVYLTFPLGEQAMRLSTAEGHAHVIDDGMILALGCCLYIGTGMVLGSFFHWALARVAITKATGTRIVVGTILATAIWIINFYLILSWLQPSLFGGDWITSQIPWWVALATHLVFGWTMAILAPFGAYVPYLRPTETSQAHA